MSFVNEVLLLISFLLLLIYLWVRHRYSYWKQRNVPNIKPFPILGNLKDFIVRSKNGSEHFADLYNHPNVKNESIAGIYLFFTPSLMIRDLNLVKQILVKDFHTFTNRFATTDRHRDGLGWNNLFMLKGQKWKELRSILTPFFTSGKLKMMFPLITEVGKQFDAYLFALDEEHSIQNVRELTSAYTTDVIASVAFGVKANSLKNPNGEFRRHGRMITKFSLGRAIEVASIFFFPHLVSLFRAKQFSKKTSEFFRKSILYVIELREKSGVARNDLIDILVSLKKANGYNNNSDFLVAQAALFFSAGFHTSSSAITFTLYELAKNREIQKRLRSEIKEVLRKSNGTITYDMLLEMEYLRMVLDETLRLYPPLPYLDRQCLLPEEETEYSLKPYSNFAIPNGMPVSIPFFAIQRDPKYFTDPLNYNPERFNSRNSENIVPFSYMPFGIGQRSCIGERLAKIQTKVGLISILRNHFVTTCDKTPTKMVMDTASLITQEKGPLYIKFVRDVLETQ